MRAPSRLEKKKKFLRHVAKSSNTPFVMSMLLITFFIILIGALGD